MFALDIFDNITDSIPGVGHGKAFVYFATGDEKRARKVIYKATRPVVVAGGGTIGCAIGGPAGAAVGGMYGGLLADSLASAVEGETVGTMENYQNIGNDIKYGRNPLPSVWDASLEAGSDAFTGYRQSPHAREQERRIRQAIFNRF